MYMNYNTKMVKKYILVFSPFLSFRPERKEEKNLESRMFTSFSADKIRTRRVMTFKMKNP